VTLDPYEEGGAGGRSGRSGRPAPVDDLLPTLRDRLEDLVALVENPYSRGLARRIVADVLGLVEDDQRVWETTCRVHEERIDELEEAVESVNRFDSAEEMLDWLESKDGGDEVEAA
jgi:hypothetical protein